VGKEKKEMKKYGTVCATLAPFTYESPDVSKYDTIPARLPSALYSILFCI
jgi:hypothetical protein